jgi:23S rRNA pseudouridine2457 synthase
VANHKYYIVYKPFGMLSQFTTEAPGQITLRNIKHVFETDIYPVGRLDKDSEGILLLTNDKTINDRLLNPKNKHKRTYLVQVDGAVEQNKLALFEKEMEISIDGKMYKTLPAKAKIIAEPNLPPRQPPIRVRLNIPTTWISIELIEGKNHQVRKMTAKIGYPTLRLVRKSIEKLDLGELMPGETQEIPKELLFNLLKL